MLLLSFIVSPLKASLQEDNSRLKFTSLELSEVFDKIEELSNCNFVFNYDDVRGHKVSADMAFVSVENCLNTILKDLPFKYKKEGDLVIIAFKKGQSNNKQNNNLKVWGMVVDEKGLPLPGANIIVKSSGQGTISDVDGKFMFRVPRQDEVVLMVSFIGMKTKEVEFVGEKLLIKLEEDKSDLGEVVINGYFTRKQESFTGKATTVSGQDIIAMGSQDVIKSLSLLDPSIRILENNEFGSDPNQMPEIRVRGDAVFDVSGTNNIERSALEGDPNLPTFILDDFETNLQTVLDLDINRIESVTILKDASATAIYGSRAANGVFVIKTKRPQSGKLQVTYGLDLDFNFPDLSSYDLLNGEELWGLQKDVGLYGYEGGHRDQTIQIDKWIAQGVDVDWLAQPVRNTVGQRHSLNLMGGDNHMRYMLDLSYADRPGVMKGSSRENSNIGVSLEYKLNDKLSFRNRLSVNKNQNTNSPFGAFSEYTLMPGYLPLYDQNGDVVSEYTYKMPLRGTYGTFSFNNPVYEASVGNVDESAYVEIINNFSVNYTIVPRLLLKANVAYTLNTMESNQFISPLSNTFKYYSDPATIGYASYTSTKTENVYGNAVLTYSKGIKGHFFNVAVGVNAAQDKAVLNGFEAEGFASRFSSSIGFANGYVEDGVPIAQESTTRLIGLFSSANYSFKNKYLLDLTYRLDGSSQYGSDDKTAGFYSIGTGWNVHKEGFLADNTLINQLKFRFNFGTTGSVNFPAYQAKNVFQYYRTIRYTDNVGVYLKALGNESLKWQTTFNKEFGVDLALFKNTFDLSFSLYDKHTVDMLLPITTPPSLGFDSYQENLGEMSNKGYELSLRVNLIKKNDLRWSVYANASHNEGKILEISNSLKSFNDASDALGMDEELNSDQEDIKAQASHDFLVRFTEGNSTTAIYAVRSLGIDPMTGEEVFLDKNGEPTFEWNADDKVVVGDTEPTLLGTFGSNLGFKGFNLAFTFQYRFGGQRYNSTLVQKVENSNKVYNVHRIVLEDTWNAPGDMANFKKNISNGVASHTFASSRFVQDDNTLQLSSVNLSYDVPKPFCEKIKMKSLRLSFQMTDVLYFSTINRERGVAYPYARTYTVGLRSNF